MENMRITDHPVLGPGEERNMVTIYYEGKEIQAFEGEPIAAALMAAGIRVFRTTETGVFFAEPAAAVTA